MFSNLTKPPASAPPPTTNLPSSYTLVATPSALFVYANPSPGDAQHLPRSGPKKRYEGRALRFEWHLGARADLVEKWREPDGTVNAADALVASTDGGQAVRAGVEGVVGVLKLFHDSYLILVASSTVAGQLLVPSRTAFAVDSVLAVPLDGPRARKLLIEYARKQRKRQQKAPVSDDSDDLDMSDLSDLYNSDTPPEADEDAAGNGDTPQAPSPAPIKRSLSGLRGLGLGRYLLARNRSKSRRNTPPPTPPPALVPPPSTSESSSPAEPIEPIDIASRLELDRKIVREVGREARGLLFARDWDITRRLQAQLDSQGEAEAPVGVDKLHETLRVDSYESCLPLLEPGLPLYRQADRSVWWNRFLSRPLVDAKADEFVMVLMQGFFQSADVSIPIPHTTISPSATPSLPSSPLLPSAPSSSSTTETLPLKISLLSRRSTFRPGLRYQRRGVDSAGHVANAVETEFIVGAQVGEKHLVASYVQIRGSIPLFWSQSPWALKPPPVLERGPEENAAALKAHFDAVQSTYGEPVLCVCLAETTGGEGKVVGAYQDGVKALAPDASTFDGGGGDLAAKPKVRYVGWDFHRICKGMAYGNIRQLVDQLASDLEHQSYFWTAPSGSLSKQVGVCRVNCIDCLDRTNVVESAFAKHMLNVHLVRLGVGVIDGFKNEALDTAFNELWANNGDAISRQYAGTSALKGDFVRTGRRDWRGIVNDATNSVGRLWQNTIADFFKQACIDYVMGVNLAGFSEFQETLTATDPGEILRLSRIRRVAIETTSRHVLPEGEQSVGAWTLLSPMETGVIKGGSFEEKVLLLTAKAVYVCGYEYNLQKVRDYTRIPLAEIEGLQKGAYILSTFTEAARSTTENYGFVLRFRSAAAQERINTYTIRNRPVRTASMASIPPAEREQTETTLVAFKAMRRTLIEESEGGNTDPVTSSSGKKVIEGIAKAIVEQCSQAGSSLNDFVKDEAIISLAEAERATGLLDRVARRAKNFIWL